MAIALLGAAIWYFAIRDSGSGEEVHGPSGAPFTVDLQPGWKSLSERELANLDGAPLAVLRDTKDTGVIIINSQPPTKVSLDRLSGQLQRQLAQRIPDFKLIDAKLIDVKAGEALSITYARTKKGTVNNLVVVPAEGQLYTLNATVPTTEKQAADQAQQIIGSFDT